MTKFVLLQDLLEYTRDGEWGKGEAGDGLVEMAVIRGTDFAAVRFSDFSSVPTRYIPASVAARKKLQPGDILLETAGGTKDQPTGRTVFLSDRHFSQKNVPLTCASFSRFLRVKGDLVNSRYLFWYLQSIYESREMLPYHIQHTGVARFQYTDFASQWRVPIPSLSYQSAIADVLGSFDDKIELNRRMNETLEAMAQAIFRDWFVDFGPTRRKLDGATDPVTIMGGLVQDAERAQALADLYPAVLGDGGVPEGWHTKGLDEIADFLNGIALQKHPAKDGEDSLPVIKIAELRSGITPKSGRASRSLPRKYIIHDGDFLFSWSGSLLAKFWTEGVGALNQHLFKVSSAAYPSWFFAHWIYYHMPEFQRIAASKATTMGHIQRSHLSAAQIICPHPATIEKMGEIIQPIVDRTIHNDLETRTLTTTRDLILPKLMSGEIRLGEAVEAAA